MKTYEIDVDNDEIVSIKTNGKIYKIIEIDETDPPSEIDMYGNRFWKNENGHLHRDNDLPAIEMIDGTKSWYNNGQRHRGNDLPAIVRATGYKAWWFNGKRHRENGLPAVEYIDGGREWWEHGKWIRVGSV